MSQMEQRQVKIGSEPPEMGGSLPAKRGRGRPVGDRAAKRAELVKVSIAVVAEEGFPGASLRKVAHRAGCTTGALTYYFKNKEAMVSAIMESLWDDWDSYLAATEDDLRLGFERFLSWTNVDESAPWLAVFQLIAHARLDADFAEIYQRRYAKYRKVLAAILKKGQKRGDIRGDIPADILADQLCAMADGWMIMLPIESERFASGRLKILLDSMLTLISATEPRRSRKKKL